MSSYDIHIVLDHYHAIMLYLYIMDNINACVL
eukprot:COSAG01_NODE_40329_length_465_cov_0.743169_1_plen_31_part_10